jgi:hypothetical protein
MRRRLALLQETTLILWDEFLNNNKEIFDSLMKHLDRENVVFLCVGDPRQILPVVPGPVYKTIEACFTSSRWWPRFRVFTLHQNMRLTLARAQITADTTDEERELINQEIEYAATIKAIGEGNYCK